MNNLILIIDDEEIIRNNISKTLELAGYRTITVSNGREAVAIIHSQIPGLILCGDSISEMNGYLILHLLKRNPATQNIPFLFLTAKIELQLFRKGMGMGADDYLVKPCDDVELLNTVELRLKKNTPANEPAEMEIEGIVQHFNGEQLTNHFLNGYDTHIFTKRQELYHEGKRPQKIFYLLSGKVKTIKTHPDGKEYITNVYTNGDFLGYIAVIENINYDDTAIVLENSEIVQIPRQDFIDILNQDATIATKFIQLAGNNAREKEERLINLAYSSLRKRIAVALLQLNKKFNPSNISGIPLNITRENFARYVGTATESVIRTMIDFRDEKLIDIDPAGRISIINPGKLDSLIN